MKSKVEFPKIEPGTKVKIKTKDKNYEGIFIESYDPSVILIKLKNGYNVGFNKKEVSLEILEKPKIEEKESEIEQDKRLQTIAVIITGGTIASKINYETGGVSPNPKISDLIKNIPGLEKIARIKEIRIPFLKLSGNINHQHWKKLAKEIVKVINNKDIKGAVILHGTDTLHYTASALSFMLKDLGKPVVLTYSQRSIDRGSSDAHLNLKCAFHASLSNIAEVIVVGHASINDDYCYALRGSSLRKMHSSRRDAFKAINQEPIAKIYENGKMEFISTYRKRNENLKTKAETNFEEKIALIKFYPGQNPEILDYYLKRGYKGIVIEGTGFGHVCIEGKFSWLNSIKRACKKIPVIMTTQCIYGEVNPHIYSYGRLLKKAGVIFLNMVSETCLIKLGCILGKEKNIEVVKDLMKKNFCNEINERIVE